MSKKVFTMVFNTPEDLSKEECDLYSSKITNYARDIIPNITVESSLITDNNRSVINLNKKTSIVETSDASYQVASAITGHMHDDKFFTIKTYMLDEGDIPVFSDVEIVPNKNDIYVDIFTNVMYNWDGTNYIAIASPSAQTTQSDTEENTSLSDSFYEPGYFILRSIIRLYKSIEAENLGEKESLKDTEKTLSYVVNSIGAYRDKFSKGKYITYANAGFGNRNYKIITKRIDNGANISYLMTIEIIIGDPHKKFYQMLGNLEGKFELEFRCKKSWYGSYEVLNIIFEGCSDLEEAYGRIQNDQILEFIRTIKRYIAQYLFDDKYCVACLQQ